MHHYFLLFSSASGFGADCWFCLKSPKVEKHLVVSIGEEVRGVPKDWALRAVFLSIQTFITRFM